MNEKINKNLLYKIAAIAVNAGRITMQFHGIKEFIQKDDKSPLTKADLASNCYICNALESQEIRKIADFSINSEERELNFETRKNLKNFWLIDPLDGTKDFLAQNGGFTINIALISGEAQKAKPILGVVFAPFFNDLYFAALGLGAWRICGENLQNAINSGIFGDLDSIDIKDSNEIIESKTKKFDFSAIQKGADFLEKNATALSGKRAITGDLLACDSMFHSTEEVAKFVEKYNLKVKKAGSSLKICSLAAGQADIYPRLNGTSEWDTAAPDAILREVGGFCISIESKSPLLYNKQNIKNPHFIAFSRDLVGGEIWQDLNFKNS